jgi:cytochrome P450
MEWRGRTPTIITSDPPSHTRVRKLLQAAFSPRAILALRDTAQAVVDEMLDSVAGQSSFDFVETLAYPLPAIMIADIMGVPREDRGQFKTIARTVMRFFARANPNSELTVEFAKESDAALAEFRDYLAALLAERRRSPQDDAVSTLVHAEIDGDRLSEEELIVNLVLFLMAGHETTTNMLSTGLRLLLEHPEAMARIRENRDLLPVAIEEVIRYDAPVQRLRRVVKEDVELAGVQLRAGDPLEVVVGSADRDEAVYDQPDVFDIDRFQPDRHAPPHLAFGKGAHFCIGANLARLEGVVALGTVLDRFKDIGLAEGWTPSYFEVTNVRGVTALPIEVAWA